MRTRFRAACDRAGYGGTDWRPYDLRHTFATQVAAAGDERAVQAVLVHTTTATTRRYTLGSVDDRVRRAVLAFERPGGQKAGPEHPVTHQHKVAYIGTASPTPDRRPVTRKRKGIANV